MKTREQDLRFIASARSALAYLHPVHAGNGRATLHTIGFRASDGLLRHGGSAAAESVLSLMQRRLAQRPVNGRQSLTVIIDRQHLTLLDDGGRPILASIKPYRTPAAEMALANLVPLTGGEFMLMLSSRPRAASLTHHQRLASARFFSAARKCYGVEPADIVAMIDDSLSQDAVISVDRRMGLVILWLDLDGRRKILHSFPVSGELPDPVFPTPQLSASQEALLELARNGLIASNTAPEILDDYPEIGIGASSDIDCLRMAGLVHRIDDVQRRYLKDLPGETLDAAPAFWEVDLFTACGTALSAATIALRLL